MTGYKGFDRNFCCQGKQYAVGETFRHEGKLQLCESGFHFCTEPLAVWQFYPPNADNRFALIEATGGIINSNIDSRKACTDEITIIKELSLDELIQAATIKTTSTGDYSVATSSGDCSVATNTGYRSAATSSGDCSVATSSGDCSVATNTGDYSVATSSGYRSAATVSGYRSVATVSGEKSVAVVTGENSKARGAIGCWLVLAEWKDAELVDVQVFKVDGKKILPDTFYQLKDGQPVKVQEDSQ